MNKMAKEELVILGLAIVASLGLIAIIWCFMQSFTCVC